jgi:hypothetical protein
MRQTHRTTKRIGSVLGACLLGLAIAAAAGAAELSREDYVARVEPICKRNSEANRRIFRGAREEVKAGQLGKASRHFARADAALGKTIVQLRAVPQPATDEARLAKWLGYLEAEQDLLGRIGEALAAGDKAKAQLLSVRLNRNSNLANNAVLPFGFEHCRIDPARFS